MKKYYFIVVLLIVIAFTVGIFSYLEYFQTKKILRTILKGESENLIKALKYSIENNIKSNNLIEEGIQNSLISVSSLADHINLHNKYNQKALVKFAENNKIDLIIIIDKNGVISNNPAIVNLDKISNLSEELDIIKNNKYFWLELGVLEISGTEYYLIGGYFSDENTILITGIEEKNLLNMRKSIGVGVLLNNYSQNKDIVYMALQDTIGIIAASKNLASISAIKSDTLLNEVLENGKLQSRFIEYKELQVLESVVLIDDLDSKLILRLGLSLDKFQTINRNNKNRTIFLSIGLFVIIAVTSAFVYQRGRHMKLKGEHRQMLDYTGLLLSNINEAVIGIDKTKKIILYNHKAEQLFGKNESNINTIDRIKENYSDIFNSIISEEIINYKEFELNSHNGEKLILAFGKSIVYDESGNTDITIVIIRDITQIKANEEILRRNEKLTATGELAAGVAHEIRNPLNAINVIAQRLEYEFEPENDVEEYSNLVKIIRSEIKRIDIIISQFLEFSKSKKFVMNFGNLYLPSEKTVELLKPTSDLRQIELINHCQKELFCMLEKDKIEQIFINLIKNAIEAVNNGGKITISSKLSNEKILIAIADNGCGISESNKHQVFDLYYTSKDNGTGLGLGIVNKIMQEHNAKIWFESAINKGTTFYLEFDREENEQI